MQTIHFSDIEIQGDMAVRSILNYARLEGKWYRPDEVFTADTNGWPGDWEGRILLALTLLAQSTHRTPAYLEEILSLLPGHLNAKGYFGPILPDGVHDEQQMAGNSWFLRSLIEYYNWKKDERIKEMIVTLVKNLLFNAIGHYAKYPLDPATRENVLEWSLSKIQHKAGKHKETLDTGCAFIMLDGATHAYELLRLPELKVLIEEMIDRFLEMDLVGLQVQTHATLTALRGITRYYEIIGDPRYLQIAKEKFAVYKKEAWTEAYGNFNWFNRPRWTEPCAIIDSYMIAVQLWKLTREPSYLEDAHHIYYNAIAHAQRFTGSFGTDKCLGAEDAFLSPLTFEVYWCCTMRAGELWSRAISYNYFISKNEVFLPVFHDNTANLRFEDGSIRLREKTGYPFTGEIRLDILESTTTSPKKIHFFSPAWAKPEYKIILNQKSIPVTVNNGFAMLETSLQKGDTLEFHFGIDFSTQPMMNAHRLSGYHTFRHGPMLLAHTSDQEVRLSAQTKLDCLGNGKYQLPDTGILLEPLHNIRALTTEDSVKQVLFRE